ncbi:hypothetical protein N7490_009194 [Penicillium lividum]|nr:hypothetical protein N7490_009194 [Penicillium lividum]
MDVNVHFMSESAKRRRDQNRLAQRKFRREYSVSSKCQVVSIIPLIGVSLTEKKRWAAHNNALETSQPPQSISTVNNVDIPINSLPAFPQALPRRTGTLSPNETQISSTGPGSIEHLDLDAIHPFWDQINPDLSFPFSDSSPLQPSLAHANFPHRNSSGPTSRTAPSNSTSSNHMRSLSRSENSHSPPFHRITSLPTFAQRAHVSSYHNPTTTIRYWNSLHLQEVTRDGLAHFTLPLRRATKGSFESYYSVAT